MNRLPGAGQDAQGRAMFYGWAVVLAAFVANFMGTGTGFYIFNAFIEPLCTLRGWSRTDINIGPMLGYIVSILAGLLYGTIITRVGARIIMTACSLLTAASFYLLGRSDNLPLFYIFYMLMMMGIGGMNGLVSATVVNNWFVAGRGRAMGIATAAISLAGVILPPVAMSIIHTGGIERAFLVIALGIALVAPLTWLLVRNRPEDRGLLPDGALPERAASPAQTKEASSAGARPSRWTLAMSLRNSVFWRIGLAYGLAMASVLGVMYQLKPRFSDLGFEPRIAMGLMAGTALAGTAGKFVWAYLCDRFPAKNIAALLLACNGIGLCIMLGAESLASVIVFAAFYGFSMGGVVSTQPVIIADFFGREAFPSIARYLGVIVGINCLGYPIMGRSFDLTGSYNTAYWIFVLCNFIAAALVFSLKEVERPPVPRRGHDSSS